MVAVVSVLVGLGSIARSRYLAFDRNRHESDRQPKCRGHLGTIGRHLLSLRDDSRSHQFPASFDAVLQDGVSPDVFICPSSYDTEAKGSTPAEQMADFHKPGHCSYIYVGQRLPRDVPAVDVVLAFEPPSNHDGRGSNVLFADGHVEFLHDMRGVLTNFDTSDAPIVHKAVPLPTLEREKLERLQSKWVPGDFRESGTREPQ